MAYQKVFTLAEQRRVHSSQIDWADKTFIGQGELVDIRNIETAYVAVFPDTDRYTNQVGGEIAWAAFDIFAPPITGTAWWIANKDYDGPFLSFDAADGDGFAAGFPDRTEVMRLHRDGRIETAAMGTGGFNPTGAVIMFAGAEGAVPEGYLFCDGSAVSRTTYADLFAVIGETYGVGDGSTTFNVPNMEDRFPVGAGSTYALNDTGGAATVTLLDADMPSHVHTVNPPSTSTGNQSANHTHNIAHTHAVGGSFISDVAATGAASRFRNTGTLNTGAASDATSGSNSASHDHTVDIAQFNSGSAGSDSSHENRPPYRALNFIIKT